METNEGFRLFLEAQCADEQLLFLCACRRVMDTLVDVCINQDGHILPECVHTLEVLTANVADTSRRSFWDAVRVFDVYPCSLAAFRLYVSIERLYRDVYMLLCPVYMSYNTKG